MSLLDLESWESISERLTSQKDLTTCDFQRDNYAAFNTNLGNWVSEHVQDPFLAKRLSILEGTPLSLSGDVLVCSAPTSLESDGTNSLFSMILDAEGPVISAARKTTTPTLGELLICSPSVLSYKKLILAFAPTKEQIPPITDRSTALRVATGRSGSASTLRSMIMSIFEFMASNSLETVVFPLLGCFDSSCVASSGYPPVSSAHILIRTIIEAMDNISYKQLVKKIVISAGSKRQGFIIGDLLIQYLPHVESLPSSSDEVSSNCSSSSDENDDGENEEEDENDDENEEDHE
ncbi:hypothetical protein RCL1_006195 [Eukaryota sp. TZLM3-RCL]